MALNLAVNKKAIIDGLWKGAGAETPFSYYIFPFYKSYSADWKIPPYDPARAKQLLAEAGHPNGFEIRVNPVVMPVATDGPDVVEAVALDWEKVGIRVKRVHEEWGTFVTKLRTRKTNQTAWPYGNLPDDEPSPPWTRSIWTKAPLNLLAEGPFDKLDSEKRTQMTRALGQRLYDHYLGVQIGMKTATWAVGKKVGDWPSLISTSAENNLEYITPSGQ